MIHLIAIPIIFLLGYWLGRSRGKVTVKSVTVAPAPVSNERNGYDRPYVPGDPGYVRGIDG